MDILFTDAHLLAVNKPGGLPVQEDKTGDDHLLAKLAKAFPHDRSLGLPHRLDRPVSGAMLLTRTPEALAGLNAMLAKRQVRKTYWAIVEGAPPDNGQWEHRLIHDAHHHKARVSDDAAVDPARVVFRTLARGDRYALIELVPEGGRFHQLRVQCAAAGFPIKGDVKYGARRGEKDRTIALHARALAFNHPVSNEAMAIEAPAPDTPIWVALLKIAVTSGGVAP